MYRVKYMHIYIYMYNERGMPKIIYRNLPFFIVEIFSDSTCSPKLLHEYWKNSLLGYLDQLVFSRLEHRLKHMPAANTTANITPTYDRMVSSRQVQQFVSSTVSSSDLHCHLVLFNKCAPRTRALCRHFNA